MVVPVKTNLESSQWSVRSEQDWYMVDQEHSSKSSGSGILISVQDSEEPEIRTASVTVNSNAENYSIKVRQLGYGPAILLKQSTQTLAASGGPLAITVTSNIEYTAEMPEGCNWIHEAPVSIALTDRDYHYTVDANSLYVERTAAFIYTGTTYTEVSDTCFVIQEGLPADVEDVVVEGDIEIQPTGGQASEHQPGYDIENSFDGKFSADGGNPCHSRWEQRAGFPVTLEYFFDQKPDVDYVIYYTRSGNGNFGEVDVYTATEDAPEYRLYGSYDFKKQNAPSRVNFKDGLSKVTKIKFSVKSGLGGFVSCDEMEFYEKNADKTPDKQLLAAFTDITCTELRKDVTDEQINALPGYFIKLASMLRTGTYDPWEKQFRVQSYRAYSNVEEWTETLMTKRYSNLDNPTGIYVEPVDSLVILVGDTHGHSLSVQCIGEEETGDGSNTYVQTAAGGETRFLDAGVNRVGFNQKGMLFIMYTAEPSAEPITIHIAPESGKVSGFFDLATDKTNEKYAELINKAGYKYFCVRGERIMFYFHREKMRQAVPTDILSAVSLWDDIIGWEQELMGIEDIRPSRFNNHLFAISPEGSYMWASDYRIAFVYTYLENILLKEKVMEDKDNAWGPSHEIGHIHQPAINWPGCTESSKQPFLQLRPLQVGEILLVGRRTQCLGRRALREETGWWNMGSATHQNEDTEMHMRMYWQLWNYYHRCGYGKDFWQKLFKLLRQDRIVESDPGAGQLKFAVKACEAANADLTDFFEMWGFFGPVDNATVGQYGTWNYNVTAEMIKKAKEEMSRYPRPKHAFYYLEDRKNGDEGIGNYHVGDVGYYIRFEGDKKSPRVSATAVPGRRSTSRTERRR